MEKKQKELLVLIALLPILIIAVISAVNSDDREKSRTGTGQIKPAPTVPITQRDESGEVLSSAETVPENRSLELREKQLEISRQAAGNERLWRRDPFLPVPTPTPGDIVTTLELQGIVIPASGKAWATINGRTFLQGDDCYGTRVEKITDNSVTLRKKDGSVKTLMLRKPAR